MHVYVRSTHVRMATKFKDLVASGQQPKYNFT